MCRRQARKPSLAPSGDRPAKEPTPSPHVDTSARPLPQPPTLPTRPTHVQHALGSVACGLVALKRGPHMVSGRFQEVLPAAHEQRQLGLDHLVGARACEGWARGPGARRGPLQLELVGSASKPACAPDACIVSTHELFTGGFGGAGRRRQPTAAPHAPSRRLCFSACGSRQTRPPHSGAITYPACLQASCRRSSCGWARTSSSWQRP
jgi:hypothetical protein